MQFVPIREDTTGVRKIIQNFDFQYITNLKDSV